MRGSQGPCDFQAYIILEFILAVSADTPVCRALRIYGCWVLRDEDSRFRSLHLLLGVGPAVDLHALTSCIRSRDAVGTKAPARRSSELPDDFGKPYLCSILAGILTMITLLLPVLLLLPWITLLKTNPSGVTLPHAWCFLGSTLKHGWSDAFL